MQARTERQLGIAAALLLTAAAFVMPSLSTQIAQHTDASNHIHLASVEKLLTKVN